MCNICHTHELFCSRFLTIHLIITHMDIFSRVGKILLEIYDIILKSSLII
jgi:hypothetical protein